MDLRYDNYVEDARPRTVHHRVIIEGIEKPLDVARLHVAANMLASDSRVPPWATVQFVYPDLHAFWETTDAGTKV